MIQAAHVGPHDPQLLSEALLDAGERVAEVEAIDDGDSVPVLEELWDQDGSDVTGAAGDEDVHGDCTYHESAPRA